MSDQTKRKRDNAGEDNTKRRKLNSNDSNNNSNSNSSSKREIEIPSTITEEFLASWQDIPIEDLPVKYRRRTEDRVFVNRDLNYANISFVGFDMDYTLAVYKSPEYENLAYERAVAQLVEMGYPTSITSLSYDPSFAQRGLFVDSKFGNLLKIDSFGYIGAVSHGKKLLTKEETRTYYPSLVISHTNIHNTRYFKLGSLFYLVDACLYADLIEFFEQNNGNDNKAQSVNDEVDKKVIHTPKLDISYLNLFQDIRTAIDHVHQKGDLKKKTMENFEKYVSKDDRIATLLHRIKLSGKKTFLLTNSGFNYTDKLLSYLLHGSMEQYKDWKDYFDYIIVGAKKPAWFEEGSALRDVHLSSGSLQLTRITKMEPNHVYNGGNLKEFATLTGAEDTNVLYVGDSIFSDIIQSKRVKGWRNLLVIRELEEEINSWAGLSKPLRHLRNLQYMQASLFKDIDSSCVNPPDYEVLNKHKRECLTKLRQHFNNLWGPIFRAGPNHSYFSMQVQRYACLYTSDFRNLLHYPSNYYFSSEPLIMPHEGIPENISDDGDDDNNNK